MNAILTISPFWDSNSRTWVFNDPVRGLLREPFVAGVPAMLNDLTKNIPNARDGFRLTFAPTPFPGFQRTLCRVKEEYSGVWYRDESNALEGWFCPVFWKFMNPAPERIYARAESF